MKAKQLLAMIEASLESKVRQAIADSGVGDKVEKDRYEADGSMAYVWIKSGHEAEVLKDHFVDAGLKVEPKVEGGLTRILVYQDEAKSEGYVTPPEFYDPTVKAFQAFKTAAQKMFPHVDKNSLSTITALKKAMDAVEDELIGLGDELDDDE
jgi:hypothetical protein